MPRQSLGATVRLVFFWFHLVLGISAGALIMLMSVTGVMLGFERQMIGWIKRLQQARTRNVVFVCLLNEDEDDFGRKTWSIQIDGSKTGREMPGIVDEVITFAIIRPEDGEPYRAFITGPENEWGFPAKDRSGRLALMEKPHLGDLFAKLLK